MTTSTLRRCFQLSNLLAVVGLAATASGCDITSRQMRVNSPIFNEISGKLGGAVGLTTKYGMQLRGLVTPHNPETGAQFLQRNTVASIAAYWRGTMTQSVRDTWTELAESSEGNGSGLNAFQRCNNERVRRGLDMITTPPVALSGAWTPPAEATVVIDDSANTLSVAYTLATAPYNAAADEGGVSVYCSVEQPSSRTGRLHPFTYVGVINGTDVATPKVFSLATAGLNTVTGKVMFVRFVPFFADGSIGTPVTYRKTIVA